MIKMKMRVDDEVDLARISVDRLESCTDFFAGSKADTEKPSQPLTEPSSRIVLAIGVQSGVEECPPVRVLDKKDRDWHGDVAFATLHQTGELAGHGAASESIEVDCHLPPNSVVSLMRSASRWASGVRDRLSSCEIDHSGITTAQENPDVLSGPRLITTRNKRCEGRGPSRLGDYSQGLP